MNTNESLNYSPADIDQRLFFLKLVSQVETMVAESGDPDNFDAERWLTDWLNQPLPALGGARPVVYMDTSDGREKISNLLACTVSGVYV